MEERAFSTIIQSVTPVGKEFQNPGGGKSTIISHSLPVYIINVEGRLFDFAIAINLMYYEISKVRWSPRLILRKYKPSVFDSKRTAILAIVLSLFTVFKAADFVDNIYGSGVRGDPFRSIII